MAEQQEEQKPKSKKMVFIILFIILLAIGGGVAWYVFMGDFNTQKVEEDQAQKAEPEEVTLVKVPPFLVNLSDPLGRRFIKLTINIEVANPKLAEKVEKNMFQVRDKLILLLSSKTYGDLSALDSKIYLKNEIAERINQIIAPDVIRQVYISDMIIQ